jgi:hypothetical protein
MDLKKLALAAVAGTSLLAAAPAFAEPRDWQRGRDYGRDYGHDHGRDFGRDHGRDYGRDFGRYDRHFHRDDYRAPVRYGYHPAPRVVERVVVVQQPAPVYYNNNNPPERPVLSAQVPIGRNANINFDLRL